MERKFVTVFIVILVGFSISAMSQLPNYLPTDGLVGWWPFNGNANDESGNGHNGIISGSILTEDRWGISNSAFDFDGTTHNIYIPSISNLYYSSDFSISVWAYFRNFNNDYPHIMCGTGQPFGYIEFHGTGPIYDSTNHYRKVGFYTTSTNLIQQPSGSFITPDTVSNNSWHHFVVTKQNNLIIMYVDNILSIIDSNYQSLPLLNNSGLCFGNKLYSALEGNGIDGKLDDIGIWERALTQQEITSLFLENPCPAPQPQANDVTIPCGSNSVLNASGGTNYYWYNLPIGGSIVAMGQSFTTPILTTTTNFYVSNFDGTCESTRDTVTVTVLPCKTLNLKLFLEGLYAGRNSMWPAYDQNGPHFGIEIADHVNVELRSSSNYGTLIYSANDIKVNTGGNATILLPNYLNGSYYITVKNRNHIETTSALPVSLSGNNISYIFSNSASKAFGNNMLNIGGVFCFWSGDNNQDGLVDATDMIAIDNDARNFATGYLNADLNGDGLVDASDMILGDNNSSYFTAAALPTSLGVTTDQVHDITSTSAIGGGNVIAQGTSQVVAKGVCWSGLPNPTLSNSYNFDGSGLGSFTSNISGLSPNTNYHVRAYAINSTDTVYGNEETFNTLISWICGTAFIDTRDSKSYNTVQIGSQCWFKENLNVGTRINGSVNQTDNATIEKYCYNNDNTNCTIYGGLYQWDEMMNYTTSSSSIPSGKQGVCPNGWHIPSDAEWCQLETYLDATMNCTGTGWLGTDVGGKMKEGGTTHWLSPNVGATNTSGFTGLPGGVRHTNGNFASLAFDAVFWSSAEYSSTTVWDRDLHYGLALVLRNDSDKACGFSVRCIKD